MPFLARWLPVLLWSAVIITASDEAFSGATTQRWLDSLLGRPIPHAVNVGIRKLAHLLEYAILAALAWRAATRARVELAMLIAVTVAALDEYRQSLSAARTGSAWDVAIDLTGAVFGLLAAHVIARRFASRPRER
jgi:VanZ family protein